MSDEREPDPKRRVSPAARHDRPANPPRTEPAADPAEDAVRTAQGATLDPRRPGGIAE